MWPGYKNILKKHEKPQHSPMDTGASFHHVRGLKLFYWVLEVRQDGNGVLIKGSVKKALLSIKWRECTVRLRGRLARDRAGRRFLIFFT